MVRAKASAENLEIAAKFADAITIRQSQRKITGLINCKGSSSIFAALRQCLPSLTRLPKDSALNYSEAVSEIELNKHLVRLGYVSYRHRHRIRGTKDKWSKGLQRWRGIRFINPKIPSELETLNVHLAELIHHFPRGSNLHQGMLVSFLTIASCCRENSSASLQEESEPDVETCYFAGSENTFCPYVVGGCDGGMVRRPLRHEAHLIRLSSPKRYAPILAIFNIDHYHILSTNIIITIFGRAIYEPYKCFRIVVTTVRLIGNTTPRWLQPAVLASVEHGGGVARAAPLGEAHGPLPPAVRQQCRPLPQHRQVAHTPPTLPSRPFSLAPP